MTELSPRPRFDPASVRLIGITDSLLDGPRGLALRAAAAVAGGATMIQLRLKEESARSLVEIARIIRAAVPGVPLVVNDRADVALAAGADGVHVGVDDLSPVVLRRFVPPGFIIGASVGDDDEVDRAAGADYVGIGPVYATGSKADAGASIGPQRFGALARRCGVPAVAIGGISAATVPEVMAAGASGIAVISALFGAPDPTRSAQELAAALVSSGR
jgi:thiamine-phosphate pyrophosphorylase